MPAVRERHRRSWRATRAPPHSGEKEVSLMGLIGLLVVLILVILLLRLL
jgi:LPXTG-motif cell wall-anchored protein